MKKLIATLLLAGAFAHVGFCGFSTHVNSKTNNIDKIDDKFNDWRFEWVGKNDQAVKLWFIDSAGWVDLTGDSVAARLSRRGTIYVDILPANVTVLASNISFTIPMTNIPPNNTYQMEVWAYQGANTNPARTLGQGSVYVSYSLYQDTNTFPFPSAGYGIDASALATLSNDVGVLQGEMTKVQADLVVVSNVADSALTVDALVELSNDVIRIDASLLVVSQGVDTVTGEFDAFSNEVSSAGYITDGALVTLSNEQGRLGAAQVVISNSVAVAGGTNGLAEVLANNSDGNSLPISNVSHIAIQDVLAVGIGLSLATGDDMAYGLGQHGWNDSGTMTIDDTAYGAQQRGRAQGRMLIGSSGIGAQQYGDVATGGSATNNGPATLQLFQLQSGEHAYASSLGDASISLGAATITNGECIVVGNGQVSHGDESITAGGGLWSTRLTFFGSGNVTGITDTASASNSTELLSSKGVQDAIMLPGFLTSYSETQDLANVMAQGKDAEGGVITNAGTPTKAGDVATFEFVQGQVAAAGATNPVWGQIYIYDDYDSHEITDTSTWHNVTNWLNGGGNGVGIGGSNLTIEADGVYAGLVQFCVKRTTGNQNQDLEFSVFKNGVKSDAFAGGRTIASDTLGMGGLAGIGTFSVGDVFDLRFRGDNVVSPNTVCGMVYGNMSVHRIVSSVAGTNWSQYAAVNDVNGGGNTYSNATFDGGHAGDGGNLTNLPSGILAYTTQVDEVLSTATAWLTNVVLNYTPAKTATYLAISRFYAGADSVNTWVGFMVDGNEDEMAEVEVLTSQQDPPQTYAMAIYSNLTAGQPYTFEALYHGNAGSDEIFVDTAIITLEILP